MSGFLHAQPVDLGLPEKFETFRPVQAEALDYILHSSKRFIAGNASTGTGKSLIGVAAGAAQSLKTVYLTSTKALQDQVSKDFACVGMKDMRGRSNYECRLYTAKLHKSVSCQIGNEEGCSYHKTTACPYTAAYEAAKSSGLIVTNYSYWLHARRASPDALEVPDSLEPVELLVCDEAHNAMEELSRFLEVTISSDQYASPDISALLGSGLMTDKTGAEWRKWAASRNAEVNYMLKQLIEQYDSVRFARESDPLFSELEQLKQKLVAITRMDQNWVWEKGPDKTSSVVFSPIWPGMYADQLWSRVDCILLLSATLWPYTLKLLGLASDEVDFRRFENGWPPNRAPVWYLPTCKLGYKSTDADYATMINRIDSIIDTRLDRKGLIHTVSYDRMRRLLKLSRHKDKMIYNESASTSNAAAARFREAAAPAILISPSFSTGWDFAYDACEYILIPKVPFPYSESRVMQERLKDQEYRAYLTMLDLQQMIGRGCRAPDDRCETFILDNLFPLVYSQATKTCGKTLNFHRVNTIPQSPPKLTANSTCHTIPKKGIVSSTGSVVCLSDSTRTTKETVSTKAV